MTGRSVPEWIGATPDTAIPPRVKLRVFQAFDGICHRTKRKIRAGEPWECDHVKALRNGGENRETNLAPILVDAHKEKTAEDVSEKAQVDRIASKHFGIKKPAGRMRAPPGVKYDWSRGRYVRAPDGAESVHDEADSDKSLGMEKS